MEGVQGASQAATHPHTDRERSQASRRSASAWVSRAAHCAAAMARASAGVKAPRTSQLRVWGGCVGGKEMRGSARRAPSTRRPPAHPARPRTSRAHPLTHLATPPQGVRWVPGSTTPTTPPAAAAPLPPALLPLPVGLPLALCTLRLSSDSISGDWSIESSEKRTRRV